MAHSAAFWVDHLQMEPHAEGGHFAVVHRSPDWFPANHFEGVQQIPRNLSSHIYYVLETNELSAVHRLNFGEMWHIYGGDPLQIFYLTSDEKLEKRKLTTTGENPEPVIRVPANAWQWATPLEGKNGFSLVGCTMTPAFHEEDWEMGIKEELLKKYPHLGDFWERYCIR